MPIALAGSWVSIPTSSTSSTVTIEVSSIPSGATMLVIFTGQAFSDARNISSATLGSSSFSLGVKRGYANNLTCEMWYCTTLSTGTLTINFSNGAQKRGCGYAFFSGTATTSPIGETAEGYAVTEVTTGNMSALAGDAMIGCAFRNTATGYINMDRNGQTEIGEAIENSRLVESCYKAIAEDSSVYAEAVFNSGYYGCICGMIVKGAVVASAPPPTLMLPNRFRTHLVR